MMTLWVTNIKKGNYWLLADVFFLIIAFLNILTISVFLDILLIIKPAVNALEATKLVSSTLEIIDLSIFTLFLENSYY